MYRPILKKNATLGIVAPSTKRTKNKLDAGLNKLRELGYKLKVAPSCYESFILNLSGTDESRSHDINMMFADPEVDAIVCMGGGYGTPRIVDKLDYDMIKKNPKPFVGFSDITLLLNAITEECGFITYHGPMVCGDFSYGYTDIGYQSFLDITQKSEITIECDETVKIINHGKAEGILMGGNLSLLDVLITSPYMFDPKGKILLIEDVHEKNYRLDRMLQKLRLAGIFEKLEGVIIGGITGEETPQKGSLEVFIECFKDYSFPVLFNLPIGHVKPRLTVPIGGRCVIDSTNNIVIFDFKNPSSNLN